MQYRLTLVAALLIGISLLFVVLPRPPQPVLASLSASTPLPPPPPPTPTPSPTLVPTATPPHTPTPIPDCYAITGRVADRSAKTVAGVTIAVSNGRGAITDANGEYAVACLLAGTYSFSPIKAGYYFVPPQRTVSLPPDASGQDFVANPLPVVLVHGLNDDASSWASYRNTFLPGIGRIGYAADNLDTGKGDHVASTIDQNARQLAAYIARIKSQTKAPQVDVVAHSMGGLIARKYIDTYMDAKHPDVRQLIMLGTPNGGSNSANIMELAHDLYGAKGLAGQPYIENANFELTTYYLAEFNRKVTRRRGVPFYAVAGNYNNCPFKSPPTFNPLEFVPNDVVVSGLSVIAIPLQADMYPNPFWGTCEGDHRGMLRDAYLDGGRPMFETYVKQWLLKDEAAAATSQPLTLEANVPQAADDALAAMQFTDVHTGTLLPGGRLEFTRRPEPGVETNFIVLGNPAQMSVSLRDPAGRVITPTTSDPLVRYTQLTDFLLATTYTISKPVGGTWMTIVHANAQTPPQGLSVLAMGSLVSDLRLTLSIVDTAEPRVHTPVTLQAQLRAGAVPLTGAAVTARLLAPDDSPTQLTLLDDGRHADGLANDGVYGCQFTPAARGFYRALVGATGNHQGTPFNRTAVWVVEVGEEQHVYLPVTLR